MNALDTNVFIYRLDGRDPGKQAKARQLLRQLAIDLTPTIIPWQVLGEVVRHLRFWQDQGQITRAILLRYTSAIRHLFPVVLPTWSVLDHALDLTGRYSLSHWDSLLLGACKTSGVTTLYTEDMGAPAIYDAIQLVNPFI